MVVKSTSYLALQIFGQHLGNLLLNSTASSGAIDRQNVQKGEEADEKLGNLYFGATKIPIVTFLSSNSQILIRTILQSIHRFKNHQHRQPIPPRVEKQDSYCTDTPTVLQLFILEYMESRFFPLGYRLHSFS
jgi:hypothetical protein